MSTSGSSSPRVLGTVGVFALAVASLVGAGGTARLAAQGSPEFHDAHFHLTNYVQNGIDVQRFLEIMGTRTGRSTLFGIPLQQTWTHGNSGDFAPTYYLHSDEPLYYYSFTDAVVASAYLRLPPPQRARFDPMITGFNPADMYGVEHVRRVLTTFPGVFTGIGEFSIHKEFVSSKVAGPVASLTNPALDRILAFAAEVGLVVILHSDIDMPFAKPDVDPVYLAQTRALLARHPRASIIWAHTGLGRVVHPSEVTSGAAGAVRSPAHLDVLESLLADPALRHVNFDISWDEVAKYVVASPASVARTAALINRFPDRFLFGTDTVAPDVPPKYYGVFEQYAPLWKALDPQASRMVRLANYERVFDEGRRRVRAWEAAHVGGAGATGGAR